MVCRGVPGMNTVIIGAVPALCDNAPLTCARNVVMFWHCCKASRVTELGFVGVASGACVVIPRPLLTPSGACFAFPRRYKCSENTGHGTRRQGRRGCQKGPGRSAGCRSGCSCWFGFSQGNRARGLSTRGIIRESGTVPGYYHHKVVVPLLVRHYSLCQVTGDDCGDSSCIGSELVLMRSGSSNSKSKSSP